MLHIGDFNRDYNSSLLRKLSNESSKQIFLLGDFNIDLLKYESSELVNSFLDTLSSNFLSPQIILHTRISSLSTLIDNIFCNLTHAIKSKSGNLTSTLSGHLPHFLIHKSFLVMHHHQNTISTCMTGKNLMKKNSSLNLIARIGIIF